MKVTRSPDAGSFLARAGAYLREREAEHNLILGLCGRLEHDPATYANPYFAVVERDDELVGAAMRTPPHNVVLAEIGDERAVDLLAGDIHAAFPTLPGVLGPAGAAARFARRWQELTGVEGRLLRAERIYRAAEALPPKGVPGSMRPYAEADRELALEWLDAFTAEALPEGVTENVADILDRRLAEPGGRFALWDDGGPVSLAGCGGLTPNGIRVGPVYTPPERRRHGYATALTAALTRSLLESGRRFCFLFTDLSNPTSNSIYQQIGYEPVTDVDQWAFAEP